MKTMNQVLAYTLPMTPGEFTLEMPRVGSSKLPQVLSVGNAANPHQVNRNPILWASVPVNDESAQLSQVTLACVLNDQPDVVGQYIGSVTVADLIAHYFIIEGAVRR